MSQKPWKFRSVSRWTLLLIILAWLGGIPTEASRPVLPQGVAPAPIQEFCELENTAFVGGERMVYKLYYNLNFIWIPAGEVEFEVQDLGDRYKISALGQTYPSYEWFFRVRDRYESYVDKRTLLPTVTTREIHEGNYELFERVEYDQSARTGRGYRGKKKEEALRKPQDFEIETCLHDVLSAIYFMRNLDLENARAGTVYPVTIFMDRKRYPLGMRYLGVEKDMRIKGLGRFDAYEIAPEVVMGDVFDDSDELRVWTSVEAGHVPLQIEAPLSVGYVKAVLKDYENLRHDLVRK